MTTCTWNPSDIGSDVTLSSGNLEWATTNTGSVSGRATLGYLAGTGGSGGGFNYKLYYEVQVVEQGTSNLGTEIGFANNTESLGNFLGASTNSICMDVTGGDVFYSDSVAATYFAITAGNWCGVAIDFAHGIWWYNGSTWNNNASANPATNTGPVYNPGDLFYNGGWYTVYPAFGSRQSGSSALANFGATPFQYPVPSGFSPWLPSSSPAQFMLAG